MSEPVIKYCDICGGVKSVHIPSDPGGNLNMTALQPFTLCSGHPESKHDGRLDEDGRCHVRYVEEFEGTPVQETGILLCDGGSHDLVFRPEVMLSLRDWLIQESPHLEKLAREMKEDN